jgi:hypothetical protein
MTTIHLMSEQIIESNEKTDSTNQHLINNTQNGNHSGQLESYSFIKPTFLIDPGKLLIPLKEGKVIRCYLTRQKSFFSDTIQLFLSNTQNLLFHARKYRGKSGTEYLFGIDQNLVEQNSIARIECFKAHHQFKLFLKDEENPSMTIHYKSDKTKSFKKEFEVFLWTFEHRSEDFNIHKSSKQNNKSIKNFQLIFGGRKSLEFVKETKTKYQLVIRYPFSVLEALALACTSMNNFEK